MMRDVQRGGTLAQDRIRFFISSVNIRERRCGGRSYIVSPLKLMQTIGIESVRVWTQFEQPRAGRS
jgi:hypothetical protein